MLKGFWEVVGFTVLGLVLSDCSLALCADNQREAVAAYFNNFLLKIRLVMPWCFAITVAHSIATHFTLLT